MTAPKRTPVLLPVLIGLGVASAAGVYLVWTRRDEWQRTALRAIVERQAAGKGYVELAQRLERDGSAFQALLNTAADTGQNRDALRHIIGIEGWGQAKLAALVEGTEPPVDEHYSYKPDEQLNLPELTSVFARTRARTAEVARRLGLHPPQGDVHIRHNSLGPLTARGWLTYLGLHARWEGRSIRPSA